MKKNLAVRAAAGVGLAIASVGAFAQASGATINDTSIVSSINGVVTNISNVGSAVLVVVICAWGYRTVKGFLGR